MASVQTPKWCGHCQANVVAVARGPNTLLHFLLTLFTCFLWFPVWLWLSIGVPFRCPDCRGKTPEPARIQSPAGVPVPNFEDRPSVVILDGLCSIMSIFGW